MTTYEYLGQMYDIDRKIDRKLNEARKWYDIANLTAIVGL